jgi:hypothetical protein
MLFDSTFLFMVFAFHLTGYYLGAALEPTRYLDWFEIHGW